MAMATCNCEQDPHLPTCPLFKGIRGIDSKRRLLGFFGAKGHHNLVLRIVDVLEMRPGSQALIAGMVAINRGLTDTQPLAGSSLKGWLLHQFPDGHIVLPIDRLLEPLPLREVEKIQVLTAEYHNVRLGKGSPSKTEPCPECGGTGFGRGEDGKCEHCDGSGRIVTFLEMSDEEIALALKE